MMPETPTPASVAKAKEFHFDWHKTGTHLREHCYGSPAGLKMSVPFGKGTIPEKKIHSNKEIPSTDNEFGRS